MHRRSAFIAAGLAAALAAASVSAVLIFGGGDRDATAATTTTLGNTAVPETTTTAGTTTRAPTTTTTRPTAVVILDLEGNGALQQAARDLYAWLGDRRAVEPPAMAEGLAAFLSDAAYPTDLALAGEVATADLGDGRQVAVITAGDDVLLAADEGAGAGWAIVGAKLASLGLGAWYGEPVRLVMVIGTDARPGQNEPYYRGDSLHILASNVAAGGGAIVGIPRDAWVSAPYGNDKLTHVNALADSATLVQIVRDLTGLPLEGYLVTGFRSFRRMVDAFGGVEVDVPFAMNDPKSSAFLRAGLQRLLGQDALAFSRNRHISGGDFTRSFHQGVVIAAALRGVQEQGIGDLPELLALLSQYTWTDLPTGDLLTLAAGAYELDPDAVANLVLPGTLGTVGAASVVFLNPEAEDVYRDLEDGMVAPAG
ncbi:MAG: LCP family protein [Acidimicrobiia bacterium]|nr:LCP family protein [Acidimicrobiia bacterium]